MGKQSIWYAFIGILFFCIYNTILNFLTIVKTPVYYWHVRQFYNSFRSHFFIIKYIIILWINLGIPRVELTGCSGSREPPGRLLPWRSRVFPPCLCAHRTPLWDLADIWSYILQERYNVLIVLQLQISLLYPCGKVNSEALHALVMFGSEIFIVYRYVRLSIAIFICDWLSTACFILNYKLQKL